ncbi:MAG: DUF2953 domain-containing protein [Clostridiales bacterium]|nr:DUF2953 domain-containing protein [Clostridiales bacterium]
MIALYIILGIVLFFALLFSMKIKVYVRLTDELRIRAGFGPVLLTLIPKKNRVVREKDFTYRKHEKRLKKEDEARRKKAEKEAEKAAAKAEKAKKKAEAARLAEAAEKAAGDTDADHDANKLETILSLVSFALEEIPRFVSHFETDFRMLSVTVCGRDAADTAVKTGTISAAASLLFELLRAKTRLHIARGAVIDVQPDFIGERTRFEVDFRFRLRLFSVVGVGLHTLGWLVRQKLSETRA